MKSEGNISQCHVPLSSVLHTLSDLPLFTTTNENDIISTAHLDSCILGGESSPYGET
jgi:hypothetical protein